MIDLPVASMSTAVTLLVLGIFGIAINSIGIQCYNKCENPKMNEEHPKNKSFLVFSLVISIVILLLSFFMFYLVHKMNMYKAMVPF